MAETNNMDEKPQVKWAVTEFLPTNEKTIEILKKRAIVEQAQLEKKAQAEAAIKKQKEEQKRKNKNQAEAANEKKRLEEQRLQSLKRQEEESKQLGGRLQTMLLKLNSNATPRDYALAGIDLGTIRTGMLARSVAGNDTLKCLTMSRKRIEDEAGQNIAQMLLVNKTIRKVELEGNKLGQLTARAMSYVLKLNKQLLYLDLENNTLTQEGQVQDCMGEFIDALKENTTLLSLNLANNKLQDQPASRLGEKLVEALQYNTTLIDFEFGDNEFKVETIRTLQEYLKRNKAKYDEERLEEWNERKLMRDEDDQLANMYLKQGTKEEAFRMEEEAYEQKQKEIMQEWRMKKLDYAHNRQLLIQQLTEAAIIRGQRGKKKGRRGGGKKGKKGK